MDAQTVLVDALSRAGVRFVVIGVSGANYFARSSGTLFATRDIDVFLPPDPATVIAVWGVCEERGLDLWVGDEPLDRPRDLWLVERIVERRALVRASDRAGLDLDLTLVMAGFEFEEVWADRRLFEVDGVAIPVARLSHTVRSKAAAGRDEHWMFLATHRDAIESLIREEDSQP